uniref:C-type lectin domain-containing protein n=1 Tax=Plectus sambesii TaxID=2011161 RepID=A0A914WR52_9BILA
MKKNWTEAKAFCNNIAPNAHLTSISTAFESVELNALTINTKDISSCDQIWIGAFDPQLNGQFVWSDGTPFEYSIWLTGEPNLQYQCVSSSWEKSRSWKTTDCSLENCFICEVHMNDCFNNRSGANNCCQLSDCNIDCCPNNHDRNYSTINDYTTSDDGADWDYDGARHDHNC